MTYGLSSFGDGDYRRFDCNNTFYQHALELAKKYGWEPLGTKFNTDLFIAFGMAEPEAKAEAATWPGHYFSNDHQIVTDQDAKNIAEALEKALDDLPDIEAMEHKHVAYEIGNGLIVIGLPSDTEYNAFEYFSGDVKNYLVEFIEFLKLGAYVTN